MNPTNKSTVYTIVALAIVVLVGVGAYRIWGIRWWEYLRRAPSEEVEETDSLTPPLGETGMNGQEETAEERGEESPPPTGGTPPPPATVSGENRLQVTNQLAGPKVTIPSISVSTTAWVVIHDDQDGEPGRILGAQRVRAGETVTAVDLLRATASGGTYYAMLHTDSGDAVFDHTKDVPMKDASGKVITVKFTAE